MVRHWYQRPVAWAFMFLFLLISLMSLVAYSSLNKIENEYIENTQLQVDKLRLLDEMVHYSRQRSVLLRDIVIAADPFRQDEIIQKHANLATHYLLARNALSEKPLTPEERKYIDQIIDLNRQGYDLQQSILEYAADGEREKALTLVAEGLGPNREKIYPAMLEMKELLVNASSQAAEYARMTMQTTKMTVIWLYLAALVIGIVIAWIAYRLDRNNLRQLDWQASHDELTGLLNRYRFEGLLSDAVRFSGKRERKAAILYLDIDQFNLINNTSGHDAGDELLRQIASGLLEIMDEHAEIGRVGGDQFAILLYDADKGQATDLANRIVQYINEYQFMWLDRAYRITVSIGVVATIEKASDKTELLSAAYLACDVAKENGGNRVNIYQDEKLDTQERRQQMDWATRIKQAMVDDKLILFRQGIKSQNNGFTHSEILLRLETDNGDIVPAGQFIPAAERYKLITDVDLYVVRKTLAFMADNPGSGCYSVNLSGISIGHKQFANQIIDLISESGVDAEKVCFEVTETAAITNKTTAVHFMNILHGIGCHFFLDDFGSGLSSFGYLRNLPIDIVKIDNHFTRNMDSDPANIAVIQAINTIAHGFGLKTVAEGVETQSQMNQLSAIGVDYFQGFYIERPHRLIAA